MAVISCFWFQIALQLYAIEIFGLHILRRNRTVGGMCNWVSSWKNSRWQYVPTPLGGVWFCPFFVHSRMRMILCTLSKHVRLQSTAYVKKTTLNDSLWLYRVPIVEGLSSISYIWLCTTSRASYSTCHASSLKNIFNLKGQPHFLVLYIAALEDRWDFPLREHTMFTTALYKGRSLRVACPKGYDRHDFEHRQIMLSCSCRDFVYRRSPCKHMFAVRRVDESMQFAESPAQGRV